MLGRYLPPPLFPYPHLVKNFNPTFVGLLGNELCWEGFLCHKLIPNYHHMDDTQYVSYKFNMAAKNSKWRLKLNKLNKMKEEMQCSDELEHVYKFRMIL